MSIEFRPVRHSEMLTVVNLWNEVFGVDRSYFESLLHSEPGWGENQSLVAVEDGEVVSSVHIFRRQVFGLDGLLYRVGCIGSVSTRESSRGKGYSGELLKLAIQEMKAMGCDWSWLFTGTNRHYARYGWVDLPTRRVFASQPKLLTSPSVETLTVAQWDHAWPELVRVHEACHGSRPLTTVRSEAHWRNAVRYRAFPPVSETRLIRVEGAIVAYAMVTIRDDFHEVRDLAWLPGSESHMSTILSQATLDGEVIIVAPIDDVATDILNRAFGEWRIELAPWSMVQPINPTVTLEQLQALFRDPSAVHLASDEF